MERTLRAPHLSAIATAGCAVTLLLAGRIAVAQAQDISVTINGQPVHFQDIGPQQINGRTMVPVRGVLEKLGASISYNNQTQTVTASTPTIDIQLKIGSTTAIVNAKPVTLDVPAQSIRDHTFVPLRFLGEALGANLKWNAATRTVVIVTRDAVAGGPERDRPERRPPPDRGREPAINSFSQSSGRWLRAGEPLRATLDGTPGGEASFRVPGLVEDVPMRETSPGHYVGTWQMPEGVRVQMRSAAVIGSLRIGDRSAPMLQASGPVSVDVVPPIVRDKAPEDKTIVNDPRPNISAVFEDRGSGIDPSTVRLMLDGRDVTREATVTRGFISYKPDAPLPPGPRTVELRLSDVAGNRQGGRWTFVERSREGGGIRSVSDNADRVHSPGDTLHVEMMAQPGGRATFSAGNIQDVPLHEDRPGHYIAGYTVRRGDDVADKPIAFRFIAPDGQRYGQASGRALRVASGKPLPPAIISPGPNAAPTNPLVIRGRAAPFARVDLRVDYSNRLLGVVALHGTALETVVAADRNGIWQSDPIKMGGILGNRGVDYTITATAINDYDERSEPTIVKFRGP